MMAGDKDIRSVKEAFDQERYSAPEGLWNAIHEEMDREDSAVFSQVQEAFDTNHKAPDQLWEHIDRALTIERSWGGLRAQLIWNEVTNRSIQLLSVAILVLLSVPLADTDLSHFRSAPSKPIVNTDAGQELIHTEGTHPVKSSIEPESVIPFEQSRGFEPPVLGQEPRFASTDQSASLLQQPMLEPVALLGFTYFAQGAPNVGRIDALIDSDELPAVTGSRFAVGALLVMNNPNLQNNTADEAARTASNTESEFSINYSFGLAGHISTPRGNLLEARYVRNKVMNQAYQRFEGGTYTAQNLVMLYDHLDLHYQRAIRLGARRPVLFIGAGAFGAYMNAATLIKENALEDRTDRYGRWDAGLSLGAKKQWNSGPLLIELDLRSEWGLTNIHRGDQIQPAQFDMTYTHNASLSMALKYSF